MTGSFLVPIITPIVAIIALACWLGMIYWAEAHPGWKAHTAAPGPEITPTRFPPVAVESGDQHGGELAPLPGDRKAA
jgi:hypothetical protein